MSCLFVGCVSAVLVFLAARFRFLETIMARAFAILVVGLCSVLVFCCWINSDSGAVRRL